MVNRDNITIILKGTYYTGNIGSTARAMMNMGLKNLILINPRCEFTQETYARARSASHLFENAPVYSSLIEVSQQFELMLGTSRRGANRLHMRTAPGIMAKEISEKYSLIKTAIVFGDEKAGLSNEDLELCAWYVTIPSHPGFESLNLAQSVMIICYELYKASLEEPDKILKERATGRNIYELTLHLEQFLKAIGFPNRGSENRAYADVKRVIASADLKRTDVNLAHGLMRFLEERYLGRRLDQS